MFKYYKGFNVCFCYCFRLDRKSSRGMVYENEELRLRTININAEVERGELKYINQNVCVGINLEVTNI